MHTEEGARMLWCPMARVNEDDRNITNRDQFVIGAWTGCLASQCAVWRWDNDDLGICKQTGEGVPFQGYCGLGGKP
jgi:hypothetical protein